MCTLQLELPAACDMQVLPPLSFQLGLGKLFTTCSCSSSLAVSFGISGTGQGKDPAVNLVEIANPSLMCLA